MLKLEELSVTIFTSVKDVPAAYIFASASIRDGCHTRVVYCLWGSYIGLLQDSGV